MLVAIGYVLLSSQSIRRLETAPVLALLYWLIDWLTITAMFIHLSYFAGILRGHHHKGKASTQASSAGSSKEGPHQQQSELYTATNCHTIVALPRGDDGTGGANPDNATTRGNEHEGKHAEPVSKPRRQRRQSVNFSRQRNIDATTTLAEIVSKQLAEMVVIPFLLFRAYGAIPRSNSTKTNNTADADEDADDAAEIAKMGSPDSISQPHEHGWTVVFISHRWWGGDHPDDKKLKKLKHGILCRGIEALILRDKLDAKRVAVWVDFACIEQDDEEEMQNGIDSLIAYVIDVYASRVRRRGRV
jgi:hypothetical protein